ncbi:MAG: TIGR04279 domain-containing protein [Candidatus Bathyarchaeota archaeon]|nr:TIGR04279 domain-containing protein [Candidatus Bathyarchaeota archaeon]
MGGIPGASIGMAQAALPDYPIHVIVNPPTDYSSLIIASHENDLTQGNWIELGGGAPLEIPDFSLTFTSPGMVEYLNNGTTVNFIRSVTSSEVIYPLNVHRAYATGDTINGTFWGSPSFAGLDVDFKLLRYESFTEMRNFLRDIFTGDMASLRAKLTNPHWSASKTLDSNGDASFTVTPNPGAGDYLLVVLREVGASYPKTLYLYSATVVEVLERDITVTAPAEVAQGDFLDVGIEVHGSPGSFIYGSALIKRSAYSADLGLTSDGTGEGTELRVNGALVANGSLAAAISSGNIGASFFTPTYVIELLKSIFDSNAVSVGFTGMTPSNNASTSLATSDLRGGEYVLITAVWQDYVDRIVAFNQSYVNITITTPSGGGAAPPPPPAPTAEDLEELPAEEAADIVDSLPPEEAADLMEEVDSSIAADIIEEMTVEDAADIIEEMNTTAAADIIEETDIEVAVDIILEMDCVNAANIIEETDTQIGATIIEEMELACATALVNEIEEEVAAEIMSEVVLGTAVEIYEEVEDMSEKEAGDLLSAAVETNNTEAFAEILLTVSDNATVGGLIGTDPEDGAVLVEEMAEIDLDAAAEKVEAMVKHKARKMTEEEQDEFMEKVGDIIEEVTVDTLVALFVEIANLPETPSTVAEIFEVVDIAVVNDVVNAWVSTGALYELVDVFGFVSDETLGDVWREMRDSRRTTLRPYFTAAIQERLPELPVFGKPEVVIHLKGAREPGVQLAAIEKDMPHVKWSIVYGELTEYDLEGAVMLIMVQSNPLFGYSSDEFEVVKGWLDEGGKGLWIASDSDFGNDALRQTSANEVLEYIGSALRIESASVEDPFSNGYAPYRVLAVSDNADPEFGFLVSGVNRSLFHGPGTIIGHKDGRYIKLEEESIDNVHVLMTTTSYGVIVNSMEPPPQAHEAGEVGAIPVMALEIDPENTNVIIASGDAPFGHFMGMYKPELIRPDRYGPDANPQEGARLFENIVDYVTQYSGLILGYAKTIDTQDIETADLESQTTLLQTQISVLESSVTRLKVELSNLEGEIPGLESQVGELGTQMSGLEATVSTLNEELASSRSSANSWQLYTVMFLLAGIAAGFFINQLPDLAERAREQYPQQY